MPRDHRDRNRFESQLTAEREATLRYKGENGIMKKKFTVLTKDIEDQKVIPPKEEGIPEFRRYFLGWVGCWPVGALNADLVMMTVVQHNVCLLPARLPSYYIQHFR